MEKNINKCYKNLPDFYGEAEKYLVFIKKIKHKEAIAYMRSNFNKNILNSYCEVGELNPECLKISGAKSNMVKFSMDSLLKNMIRHPDINFSDYEKIYNIILKPDAIKFSKNKKNCVLLFKKYNKTYQAVVKTTINKSENFLTSFRLAEH